MVINRRDVLRLGATGVVMGTLSPLVNPWYRAAVQAASSGTGAKKMLVLFLRGGADGANMIIPGGDSDYSDADGRRPTLYIPPEDGYDLANSTFAYGNPFLDVMFDTVPTDDLALCHRVGHVGLSRSHFASQQYWQNAIDFESEDGWVNRLVQADSDMDALSMPAVSVSEGLQVLFRGDRPLAQIPNLANYTLGDGPLDLKLLGELPDGDDGSGILGTYSRDADDLPYDAAVRGSGLALAESLNIIQEQGVDPDDYTPAPGSIWPSATDTGDFPGDLRAWKFFREAQDAVQLLRETECRVCGLELVGFDTHASQAESYLFPRVLRIVGQFMASAYLDLDDEGMWNDTVICVLSEFGRTSAENGSFGTDHGEASTLFLAGGCINGGVYNCDADTWSDGDMFSTPTGNPRYVAQLTDFRAILGELMGDHFGLSSDQVTDVVPGWDGDSAVFDELGLMD